VSAIEPHILRAAPDKAELKLELGLAFTPWACPDAAQTELDALPANLAEDANAKRLRHQLDFSRILKDTPDLATLRAPGEGSRRPRRTRPPRRTPVDRRRCRRRKMNFSTFCKRSATGTMARRKKRLHRRVRDARRRRSRRQLPAPGPLPLVAANLRFQEERRICCQKWHTRSQRLCYFAREHADWMQYPSLIARVFRMNGNFLSALHESRRKQIAACIASVFCLAAPTATLAVTVTSCLDDGGGGTLRSIVTGAAEGATIDFAGLDCTATSNTITLANQAGIDSSIYFSRNNLTIDGSTAPSQLTVSSAGLYQGYYNNRVLTHTGTGTLAVKNLTLQRLYPAPRSDFTAVASGRRAMSP
jgi:hypothetical protein